MSWVFEELRESRLEVQVKGLFLNTASKYELGLDISLHIVCKEMALERDNAGYAIERDNVRQRFPNFLGCGPILLLNILRGLHGGLANTKDI